MQETMIEINESDEKKHGNSINYFSPGEVADFLDRPYEQLLNPLDIISQVLIILLPQILPCDEGRIQQPL